MKRYSVRALSWFSSSPVFGFALTALLSAIPTNLWALSIDNFSSSSAQTVVASFPGPTMSDGFLAPGAAVGGKRALVATSSAGFVTARVLGGLFSHSQDAASSGTTKIIWDGGLDASPNASGLGSINLRQDGGNAFVLSINSFDFPPGGPIDGRITIYDSSDPTGGLASSATFSIAQHIDTPLQLNIPFSSFTPSGATGGALDSRVGAIVLEFSGASAALDLTVQFFGTNGSCDLIPPSDGSVLDQCGVCGGNNSSCLDCNGVPNGNATPGSACPTGLPGQCQAGHLSESCSCQPDTPPTNEVCDQIDNDCNGSVDDGGQVCADCLGQFGGSAVLDRCGVCNGDGNSCLGCKTQNLSPLLTSLDGGAKRQEALIKKILKGTDKVARPSMLRTIEKIKAEVHKLQLRNWTLAWTFPIQSTVCENHSFCASVSNLWIAEEYQGHSEELRQFGIQAIAITKRLLRPSKKLLKRFSDDNDELHRQNLALLATVPTDQFSCS